VGTIASVATKGNESYGREGERRRSEKRNDA